MEDLEVIKSSYLKTNHAAGIGNDWRMLRRRNGKEGASMYTYRIIKEDFYSGKRGKRTRTITRVRPLEIGGLYLHLGKGYPGAYRVLELISEEKEV